MNRQFVSFLFCALLSSSLGHDYIRAHESRHKSEHHKRVHHHARDNNDSCPFVCMVPNNNPADLELGIRWLMNKELRLVAVVNHTSSVAITMDLKTNLVALFNGKSGATILINLNTGNDIYWPKGSCDKSWIANESSFLTLFLKLGSLANLEGVPNGQNFQTKSPPSEVLTEVGVIISGLGLQLAERVKLNPKSAVNIVVVISKVVIVSLRGSLSIIIEKAEGNEFLILGGLLELAVLLKGLAAFSKKIDGGLQALIEADVDFKLSLLLTAVSGLEVLNILLSRVANKIDFSKILGPVFQSPESLLEVIVSFEAGIYGNLPGIGAIINNILLLQSHKISTSDFMDIVIQVAASGGACSKQRIHVNVNAIIAILQAQISTFKSSKSLETILTFFIKIKNNNLTVGGVDVSGIINSIVNNSGKVSLSLATTILVNITSLIKLNESLASLFIRLVFFILSGKGVTYAGRLLPGVDLNIDLSSSISIIAQLLKGLSPVKILSYIIRGDIIGLLKNIPFLNGIFKAVVVALGHCGKKSGDLENALKNSSIIAALFGWIRGSSPTGDINGLVFIGGGVAVSSSLDLGSISGPVSVTSEGSSSVSSDGSTNSGSTSVSSDVSSNSGSTYVSSDGSTSVSSDGSTSVSSVESTNSGSTSASSDRSSSASSGGSTSISSDGSTSASSDASTSVSSEGSSTVSSSSSSSGSGSVSVSEGVSQEGSSRGTWALSYKNQHGKHHLEKEKRKHLVKEKIHHQEKEKRNHKKKLHASQNENY